MRSITKKFRRKGDLITAVEGVDLTIQQGQFVCVVGPSGCGKSTLLNMIAGLMEPSAGSVEYTGRQVQGPNTRVGYITQKDNLLPWATVERNVSLALDIARVPTQEKRDRVKAILGTVGLTGFEQSYPHELSGGMRKRVTLARTLVYEPDTLLADEPFGALDAQLKLVMQDEMQRIAANTNTTVVFVTHDISEAIALGDRVVVISKRPGQVKLDRTITLDRPRDVFRIRFSEDFGQLYEELWSELRDDFRAGEDM